MHIPSKSLIEQIERSEVDYMVDRMIAIQERPNNPEGIEIKQFGNAVCLYSRTMPWGTFNTVKGLTGADLEHIGPILDFYRTRGQKAQFEIVPSAVNQKVLQHLAARGLYQSGFHTSLYWEPEELESDQHTITIQELREDQFPTYAAIHCRGTGLPDNGIPPVAANNQVLYNRPGWKFYLAYVHDEPAAVGVMHMKDGIASMTFAATLPHFRSQGLHRSLLRKRMDEARHNDCRLVVSQCAFQSQSHRNMERVGMRIGYVRATWTEQ